MAEEKTKQRSGLGSKLLYFTPLYSIRRAASSLAQARSSVSASLKQMKDAIPDAGASGEFPPDDVRSISDGRERFEAMYILHGWTSNELDEQIKACARTKIVSLASAIVAFSAVIGAIFFAPLWMLLFLVPVGGCVCILGFAQAFKYALYQFQLESRDFVGAREFWSRQDIWLRFVS